jgi:hypothetical protein
MDEMREKIANEVYCNVPANYDGSNPEEVKRVCEKVADAILSIFKKRLPKEWKEALDEIKSIKQILNHWDEFEHPIAQDNVLPPLADRVYWKLCDIYEKK